MVATVNREAVLEVLQSLTPGLSTRDVLQQSTCFVFKGDRVYSYNDEIACSRESPIPGMQGAVKAKQLVDLLSKIKDDDVRVEPSDTELVIVGKRKKSAVAMEVETRLPIDSIEDPQEWKDLPIGFAEAVATVQECCSTEKSQFVLTCVHVTPKFMESCDRFRVVRWELDTGVREEVLIRAESLRQIVGFGMLEMSETDDWIHFKNERGLVMSCRRYVDEYENLAAFLEVGDSTNRVTFPGGLGEVLDAVSVFSADNAKGNLVEVKIRDNTMQISGRGPNGWHMEQKAVSYEGEPVAFKLAPSLLLSASQKGNECIIATGKICVQAGKFRLAVCLTAEDEKK